MRGVENGKFEERNSNDESMTNARRTNDETKATPRHLFRHLIIRHSDIHLSFEFRHSSFRRALFHIFVDAVRLLFERAQMAGKLIQGKEGATIAGQA